MKISIQTIKDKITDLEFWVDLFSSVWSLGLLYVSLYFIFNVFLKEFYVVGTRQTMFDGIVSQTITLSDIFESWTKFLVPALILLSFFLIFGFIYKKVKNKNLFSVLLNSYIVIIVFTFLTIKIDWFISKSYSSFDRISAVEIFAFMVIYGLPIIASLILKEKSKKQYFADFLLYLFFVIGIGVFYYLNNADSAINVLFLIYSIGLLYYISAMVSLVSFLDLSTSFEDGLLGNLLYLGLPIFLMISYFSVATSIFFGVFVKIFAIEDIAINIFSPVEHVYFFLTSMINYQGIMGFVYGLLNIFAIIAIVLVVFRKMHHYVQKINFWRIFRAIIGFGFLVFYIFRTFI